jgi:hypothetical protein
MLRCACGEEQQLSITFQRSDDEEEEQHGEEERRGEEAEDVGEGSNEEEAELECVWRQTGGTTWLLLLLCPHGKMIEF